MATGPDSNSSIVAVGQCQSKALLNGGPDVAFKLVRGGIYLRLDYNQGMWVSADGDKSRFATPITPRFHPEAFGAQRHAVSAAFTCGILLAAWSRKIGKERAARHVFTMQREFSNE